MNKLIYSDKTDNHPAPGISHTSSFEFSKPFIREKKILNIGCWTGNFEYLLRDFPCDVTGIEIEKKAIKVAKSHNHLKYIEASVLNLPFRDKCFDVVTLWLVLEHIPPNTESDAFKEINRVLKDNGYVIFSTPNFHWLNNLIDVAHWMKGHRHYKVEALQAFLDESGFEGKEVKIKGGLFYTSSVIVFYIYKHIFRNKFSEPEWLRKLIQSEFNKEGFADIYMIAKKVEDL